MATAPASKAAAGSCAANTAVFYALGAAAFVVSVAATVYFCVSMAGGMAMPGGWTMSMMWMRMPGQSWMGSAAMFLLMWQAMMVAMMLPPALPMLLHYRRALVVEGARRVGRTTLALAGGYFLVWLVIGVVVYAAGVGFALATMRFSALSRAAPILSGAALIFSGAVQFTSWKLRGLQRCRDPQACAAARGLGTSRTAWRLGLGQGASCVKCCCGPMLVLLVLGAMNLMVMLLVTVIIALEKLVPKPGWIVRTSGIAAMGAGVFIMARQLF